MQLSVTGKGGKVRQVLLPAIVSRALLALRGDAGANYPAFRSRKGGGPLLTRGVHAMVKRAAAKSTDLLPPNVRPPVRRCNVLLWASRYRCLRSSDGWRRAYTSFILYSVTLTH